MFPEPPSCWTPVHHALTKVLKWEMTPRDNALGAVIELVALGLFPKDVDNDVAMDSFETIIIAFNEEVMSCQRQGVYRNGLSLEHQLATRLQQLASNT